MDFQDDEAWAAAELAKFTPAERHNLSVVLANWVKVATMPDESRRRLRIMIRLLKEEQDGQEEDAPANGARAHRS